MLRQRIHLRTPVLAYLTRLLTVLLALILIWYGAMLVLLATKVSPATVNSISAYRTIFHFFVKLKPSDFSDLRRVILGIGGLIGFLALVYLALQELPRPYLARHGVRLGEDRGTLTIEPRAIERLAEIAAAQNGDVSSAASRMAEEELNLSIAVQRARRVGDTLVDVQRRVVAELERHELPALPVNVTVTKFEPTSGRTLS